MLRYQIKLGNVSTKQQVRRVCVSLVNYSENSMTSEILFPINICRLSFCTTSVWIFYPLSNE